MACLSVSKAGNIYGGAEKSVINLANWLAKHSEHEVFLVSVEGDAKAYPIDENVSFIGNRIENSRKIATHIRICKFTKRIITKILLDKNM